MGFGCFVQLCPVRIFVQFRYAIAWSTAHWKILVTVDIMGDIIYHVSEMCKKRQLLRINYSDAEGHSYWWCSYKGISHNNSVCALEQTNLVILKQQIVLSKIILCMK